MCSPALVGIQGDVVDAMGWGSPSESVYTSHDFNHSSTPTQFERSYAYRFLS